MVGHVFTAQLLRASADGFAGIAASRLFEADPGLVERHAPGAFELWRNHLRVQVDNLASAVGDGLPDAFAAHVTWAQVAFQGRGLETAELAAGIDHLREVLQDELPAVAWAPLPAYFERASAAARSTPRDRTVPAGAAVKDLVDALVAGDARRAQEAVLQAAGEDLAPSEALDQLLVPALHETGRRWHHGEIGVGEEHFATRVLRRLVDRVLLDAECAPANGRSVMVAAVAGDAHDVATQIVAGHFELQGWRALDLGGDVPASDLAVAARRFDVDVVALSAALDVQRASVTDAVAHLRATRGDRPVLVGGPAFEERGEVWRATGADAFVRLARDAPEAATRLLDA